MASYWVFLNDKVSGPFALEQLIRQRGFSRQTLVCIDDASGKPTHWISPADIPELAHIFKAADEQIKAPSPAPIKAQPKTNSPRPPRVYTPAVVLKTPSRDFSSGWVWGLLAAALIAAGLYVWHQRARRGAQSQEQQLVQTLIETAPLPSTSQFSSLRQYFQEKEIKPTWQFERVEDALYHATLSWYAPTLTVYAFEANTQAQTVRGLNTAAVKLLTEGFPPPASAKPRAAPAPKKDANALFSEALDSRRAAMESGDFSAVWDSFSRRKKAEMSKGGISREGFLRLQSLTHRVESSVKQTVLKTKPESDTVRLVLIKQTQSERPDIFIKQQWTLEQGQWKLDDEEKKSAEAVPSPKSEVQNPKSETSDLERRPANAAPSSPSPAAKPVPSQLPGMSN